MNVYELEQLIRRVEQADADLNRHFGSAGASSAGTPTLTGIDLSGRGLRCLFGPVGFPIWGPKPAAPRNPEWRRPSTTR